MIFYKINVRITRSVINGRKGGEKYYPLSKKLIKKGVRMKEIKRKILLWLVVSAVVSALFAVMALSGCKTGETAQTTAAQQTASGEETTAAPETTTPAETTPGEKVELVLWHMRAPDTNEYNILMQEIADFEAANPNIKITAEQQPSNEMGMMIQTLLAAHRGPDIMDYWEGEYLLPLKDNMVDLKDYFTKEQIDEFNPMFVMSGYYNYDPNDKLIGWPEGSVGFHFWFYNKAMFKDAGITWEPTAENKFRMTWDEFLDANKKLKAKGYTPIGWGNEGGFMTSWYFDPISFNYLEENDWMRLFTGEMKFNDPKYVQSITKLNDLVKAGYFNKGGLTLDWNSGLNLVKEKKVAMQDAFWGNNTKDIWQGPIGNDLGMMLWPVINADNPTSYKIEMASWAKFMIPTWSQHPKEAAAFLGFITNKEQYQKYCDAVGGFGARKDFDPVNIPDDGFGPYIKTAWQWLSTQEYYPPVQDLSWPLEIFNEQAGKSIELFNGQINEQQFCDALQARFEQLDYPWITTKAAK